MGAKPTKHVDERNGKNFATSSLQSDGNMNVLSEIPMNYSYPYYQQQQSSAPIPALPQPTYPNLMCMSQSPQATAYAKMVSAATSPSSPSQLQTPTPTPTPAPSPYQTSQSVAFENWQYNAKPMMAAAGTISTLGRMNAMNRVMRPYEQKYDYHTLKFAVPHAHPPLHMTPPPPLLQPHPHPQPLHHQLMHAMHPPPPPPPLMQASSYGHPLHSSPHSHPYVIPYHASRVNSLSTANSSKSSSSFSSMS